MLSKSLAGAVVGSLVISCSLALVGSAAHAEVPFGGALGARAACEKALVLEAEGKTFDETGKKVDSRFPCNTALRFGGQSEDQRNEVASLLGAGRHATLDDLAVTSMLADAAIRRNPDEPWGHLARCDIARRLGNAEVMRTCVRELLRVAPDHPETLRLLASPVARPPAWVWLARALLVGALIVTFGHAAARLRRRLRARRGALPRPVVAFLVVLASLAAGGAAVAEEELSMPPPPGARGPQGDLSAFKIDDANPDKSVPSQEEQNKHPLQFGYFIQDVTSRAEAATAKGDHAAAARYYTALSTAAPTVAVGPRKLCEALQKAGDLASAVKACRTVLVREGATAGDFTRFISLVLAQRTPMADGQKDELYAVLKHMEGKVEMGSALPTLRCEVAVRFSDVPTLEQCTGELEKLAPRDPKTVSYQWALAIAKQDRDAAVRLIDRAKDTGMKADGLAQMERVTNAMSRKRVGRFIGWAAVAALLAFSLRHGLRWLASRRGVTA
jgi:hypothetical protein